MHLPRLLQVTVSACVLLASTVSAAPAALAKETTPADAAAEAFFKLRDAKGVPPSAERFNQIIESGKAFLTQYPTHGKAVSVIQSLATFDGTMSGKELAPMRSYWVSLLGYASIGGASDGQGEDAQAAMLALGAATAWADFRLNPNRANLDVFREKIDRLAAAPASSKFLVEQERAYVRILAVQGATQAAPHAKKLLAHPNKKVAAMAQEELNLIELAITPLELKFTTIDGRAYDVTESRGKALYIYFWSLGNETSVREVQELKATYFDHRKKSLEIIAVSHDKDTAAVAKFVKDKKIQFPVLCDGTGGKDELSQKLNAKKLPATAIFDNKGLYINNTIRPNKLLNAIKAIMGIK